MKYKSFDIQVKEAGEDTPSITAYASTFDRDPDSYGDVVARGAFADSLKKWEESGNIIPLLFGHRTDDPMMNIGKVTKAVEDDRGLLVEAEFDMDNPNGAYAHKLVMEKRLCKLSFAFDVLEQDTVTLEDGTKANELRKLDIFEVSLVPIPANQHAEVISVKEGAPDGEKAGRRNSKADEEELNRIGDLAGEIQDVVSGLIDAADDMPESEPDGDQEEEPKDAKSDEKDDEQTEANACKPDSEEEEEKPKTEKENENMLNKDAINQIGKSAEGAADNVTAEAKSMGELAAKSIVGKGYKGTRFSAKTAEFKAASDTNVTPASIQPAITDYDRNVYGVRKSLGLADLFATENISGNALTYYIEAPVEGDYAKVSENGAIPQVHFGDPVAKTVSLEKTAAFYKESDEIIEDAAWLTSSINNRAIYLMNVAEEKKLVTDLLGTSGLGTMSAAGSKLAIADIKKAKTAVKLATGFIADAVVLNPADYDNIILDSLTEKYFVNPWGSEEPRLWGMAVYQSEDVAEGTCVVGAFRQGGSVVRKGGMSVEAVNTNEDDFNHGRVTIRIEERFALAVRYPGAFCKVTAA